MHGHQDMEMLSVKMVKNKEDTKRMEKNTYYENIIKYISIIGGTISVIYFIAYCFSFFSFASQVNISTMEDYVSIIINFLFSTNMFFTVMLLATSVYLRTKNKIAKNFFLILLAFELIPMIPRLYGDFTSDFSPYNFLEILEAVFFIISGYYLLFNRKVKREFKDE